ncbi:MAG: Bud site selection protein bud4 [Bathelium mastoideum]|nr:MAG: Bud site selection protein bud4 [Bathelium mastoideum]
MSGQAVEPLRINKGGSASSSPTKMASPRKNRPLSEINPMERRRNSPSFPQAREAQKSSRNRDSSPFDSSPFNQNSPRSFWHSHEGASPTRFGPVSPPIPLEQSPSIPRRSSIENLKKASRVKNSSMFAREHKNEYDPTYVPQIERPLAAGRPFKTVMKENSFEQPGNTVPSDFRLHKPSKSVSSIPLSSPFKSPGRISASNLRTSQQLPEPESSIMSDFTDSELQPMPTPRARVRHAKSVTFDTEAPVINEYEEQTPEPSSIASGSRASSYDLDEESDEEFSFDHGSSFDQEDSFDASLEDTDKTPVVLPEDWRHMSPEAARTELVEPGDDVFKGNDESPDVSPSRLQRPSALLRSDSSVSEDSRPLPPVPNPFARGRRDSGGLSSTADRMSSFQRSLPSPPKPASVSKAEILGMRDGSLSLDDRFRLMELQDSDRTRDEQSTPTEDRNELGANAAEPKKQERSRLSDIGVPRISRESILRKVRSREFHEDFNYSSPVGSERASPERSYGDLEDLDPDVPIPSREASSNFDEQVPEAPIIKKEPSDNESEVDVYAIPEMYSEPPEERLGGADDYARESSVVHHKITSNSSNDEDDDTSQYSTSLTSAAHKQNSIGSEEDGRRTPTQEQFHKSQTSENADDEEVSEIMDMSEFESYLHHQGFEEGVKSFMESSSPPNAEQDSSRHAQTLAANLEYLKRNMTPEEDHSEEIEPLKPIEEERSDTPDSVVHHATVEEDPEESLTVPEPIATIKSSGGSKLKTRHSATPADMEKLAAYRRQVSGERPPPIPSKSEKRISQQFQFDIENERTGSAGTDGTDASRQSIGNVSGMLDIPVGGFSDDLGLGLKQEFDRVIESQKVVYTQYLQQIVFPSSASTNHGTSSPASSYEQNTGAEYVGAQPFSLHRNPTHKLTRSQKGYLMRQNTKVVVASSRQFSGEKKTDQDQQRTSTEDARAPVSGPDPRGTRSAGNSPRKPSQNKAWATEPWNGKIRRKSVRVNSGTQKKAALAHPPPMPGQESAVGKVEPGMDQALIEETEEGAERGRLFVKVVGIKDLDLPLPRNEKTHFQLTLDNGLHCVTTAWLELGHAAPIGQEFELVVLNDLEFQLTLQTKIEQLVATNTSNPSVPSSPTKSLKPQKSSTFSRFLSSPKKRREAELRAAEAEATRKQEVESQRRSASQKEPTAWDLLHDLVASDGSFARAYIALSAHVRHCYGRSFTVSVPCYNEWALETDPQITNSVRSKQRGMGGGGPVRKPPYKVGKLELQLLYVPRVHGVGEEDMPRSLGAAVRELREAERDDCRKWEGFLSQQGGDCPFWRRRFFKLSGSKLVAYHEYTNQPRATINLAKAAALIDDKTTLTQPDIPASNNAPPSPTKSSSPTKSKRRKSGFAEDEEGYMFVEEGFRIRFANGEVIDFYAENAQDKQGWMGILSEVVGKGDQASAGGAIVKKWCQVVLAKEKSEGRKPEEAKPDTTATQPASNHARNNSVQRKQLPPNPPQPTRPSPQPQPQQLGPPVHPHPQVQSAHARTKSAPSSPVKAPPSSHRPQSVAGAATTAAADDSLPIPHHQSRNQQQQQAQQQAQARAQAQAQAQAQAAHYQHREREREREQIRARQAAMQAASPTKAGGAPASASKMRVGGRFGAKRDGVRSMIF